MAVSRGRRAQSQPRLRGRFTAYFLASLLSVGALSSIDAPRAIAAKAAVGSFGGEGTQGGKFSHVLEGIAVNQTGNGGAGAGDVYVADTTFNRIQQFTATGEFIRAFGLNVGGAGVNVCTVASSCVAGTASSAAGGLSKPLGIAVDQLTGVVYVADFSNLRISAFSATGIFEGAFGWGVRATGSAEELQFCTALTGCQEGKAGVGPGQFGSTPDTGVVAVAVSPLNGHVLAADSQNRRINEFAPVVTVGGVTGVSFVRGYGWGAKTGAEEFQICTTTCHAPGASGSATGQFGNASPRGLAVNASGVVSAVDGPNKRVETFDSNGNALGNFAGTVLGVETTVSIAIDPATNHVFVVVSASGGRRPLEFDAAGNLLETYFPVGGFPQPVPIAIGPAERVYVAVGVPAKVYRLGTIIPPTAEIEEVETPTGTSAKIKATINPVGLEGSYRIEFSTDGGTTWSVKATGEFPADEADHVFTTTVAGLVALTEYQTRVVAEKVFGSGSAEDSASFTTPAAPPVLGPITYAGNSDTCVTLKGSLNPENQASTYAFEYVTEAQFAEDEFAQAKSAPLGGGALPAGPAFVPVAAEVCGLTPRTTYRFRLAAQNPTGPATGTDASFATFTTAPLGLPDGRAYEQASPVDKNGADIHVVVNSGQTSLAGDAVTFFTNAGLPGAEGAQDFPIFMARRNPDASGWTTQGLLPPASTGPRGFVRGWTDDLRRSYASNFVPGSPKSFYERNTLTKAVRAIAADPVSIGGEPVFAGASQGDDAVLFEDESKISTGAVADKSNVYLWDEASNTVVLAGVMNSGSAPAEGAFAGPYDWFKGGGTSVGGASSGYYTYEGNALARDRSAVYFTAAGTGQLYVRLNPLAPQSATSGESNCTEAAKACTVRISRSHRAIPDPNGDKPAAFLGAAADGSKALFSSNSELTEDANTGPSDVGRDLYLYEEEGDGLTDLTPKVGGNGAEVKGVLGYSDDFSRVYFVANGVLGVGATPGTCNGILETMTGECNLYLWQEGGVKFIARLAPGAEAEVRNWAPTSQKAGESEQRTARVSSDGNALLFRSRLQQTSYPNSGVPEMYRYVAGTEEIRCVSCNPTAAPPSGSASVSNLPTPFARPASQGSLSTRNLSSNGKRLFFDTPDRLLSTDTNGVNDVYEWEAEGEGSCTSEEENGGCLYLISSGTSPRPSYFVDADTDGSDVFILTAQPLVAQDKDELVDVYDARIGGGIPGQEDIEPPPCVGEACVGPASTEPLTPKAATPGFFGPGNVSPVRCKKGFKAVKKKGRTVCMKVKKHKKHDGKNKKKSQRASGGKG
jgi:hypothetical protein